MDDLKKMCCRICLKDAEPPVDIFAKQTPDESLPYEPEDIPANLIKECTRLNVDEGDGHHQHLCEPCFKALRKAYRFKRRYSRSMQRYAPVKRELTDEQTSIIPNDAALEQTVNVKNEIDVDAVDSTAPVFNEAENDNTAAEYFEIIETDDLDLTNIKTEEDGDLEEMGNTITPDTPLMKRPFTIRVVAQEEDPPPNIAGPPPLLYQCIHCPKTFPKKVQLILHSRSHKKEKSSNEDDQPAEMNN
ncbi:uncharacterized zinc finger protein CG2678 [Drosophila miranda]|uniref:uncharacterized zinc finger protein CG2678 n=1 Tax=Drosophila miranda TaxID=7229 RepID=UPI0007E78CE4|nr:uncharacterized zinc finger protein CG2678 [Drosophila miranda]